MNVILIVDTPSVLAAKLRQSSPGRQAPGGVFSRIGVRFDGINHKTCHFKAQEIENEPHRSGPVVRRHHNPAVAELSEAGLVVPGRAASSTATDCLPFGSLWIRYNC